MDPLVFALRRYAELVPKPGSVQRFKSDVINNLRVWVEKDVCNAIRPFLVRAKFQDHAAWALRTLVPGSKTQERRAIEAVDHALIECANHLTEVAVLPSVSKELHKQHPPQQVEESTSILIGGPTPQVRAKRTVMRDTLHEELAFVQHISNHFWTDLVCTDDYFAPGGGLSGNVNNEPACQLLNSLTRQLHPIGDLVTECLMQRVDQLHQMIREFQSKCLRVIGSLTRDMPAQRQKCTLCLEKLGKSIASLKSIVAYDPYSVRSACVVLTQIYLCFNPKTEVAWLGLGKRSVEIGSVSITAHPSGWRNVEFFDQVSIALKQLRQLYKDEPRHQSSLEEAIAGKGLVIDEIAETAFWGGEKIATSWSTYPKSWTLLIALARASRSDASINDSDVYDPRDRREGNPLPQLVNRTKRLLPLTLRKAIEPGVQKGSYRLKLPSGSTHIFSKTALS